MPSGGATRITSLRKCSCAWSPCDFIQAAYDHGWVISYDWPEARAWAESLSSDPALLSATDLGDLRRLITLHVRLERFCDGHIAAMIRSGHLGRVLRRLTALRDPLPDTR